MLKIVPKTKVKIDPNPSKATQDFTLKLTQDVVALLSRSMSVMAEEISKRESVAIMLSVLALAGVSTASGAGFEDGAFAGYTKIAERELRKIRAQK